MVHTYALGFTPSVGSHMKRTSFSPALRIGASPTGVTSRINSPDGAYSLHSVGERYSNACPLSISTGKVSVLPFTLTAGLRSFAFTTGTARTGDR